MGGSYREVIKGSYDELNNLTVVLKSYVDVYRLLIGSVAEMNNIAQIKKGIVKDAIDRVEDMGELIDAVIESIENSQVNYLKYCKVKNEFISAKSTKSVILDEIHNEIDFENTVYDEKKR